MLLITLTAWHWKESRLTDFQGGLAFTEFFMSFESICLPASLQFYMYYYIIFDDSDG